MLKAKIGSMVASAALLATVFAPAASAASVNVGGNGAFSHNKVNVNKTHVTSVVQKNYTTAVNSIGSNANTGNNSSSFNTGGGSAVLSGPATSTVSTATIGGHNNALLAGNCGCVDLS